MKIDYAIIGLVLLFVFFIGGIVYSLISFTNVHKLNSEYCEGIGWDGADYNQCVKKVPHWSGIGIEYERSGIITKEIRNTKREE